MPQSVKSGVPPKRATLNDNAMLISEGVSREFLRVIMLAGKDVLTHGFSHQLAQYGRHALRNGYRSIPCLTLQSSLNFNRSPEPPFVCLLR